MHLLLGVALTIVVSLAEAIEMFLKIHGLVFASRPSHEAAKYISSGQKGITFVQYCSYWRNMRCTGTFSCRSEFHMVSSLGSDMNYRMVSGEKYMDEDIEERGFKSRMQEGILRTEKNPTDYEETAKRNRSSG
ncbi:hypothetical protein SADUNF_Sadunf05G0055600 [Salix dunnii]|uniref:Uncharacterized protein n=1 Tax=Salix dunnii TaxID=1413687 RepID=A0A835K9S2_9ROSI|nr:hypothetical protein SADUNF_Sadunf05G0055600 [Salix dunnii]